MELGDKQWQAQQAENALSAVVEVAKHAWSA